ncbi:NADPH-dependent 7-cyano-7-deazaguanine reductase QueF [bacterium]|nr:NADPH-dependent 7-cyano-7-deazaguanine reductase QueF [bacterium]
MSKTVVEIASKHLGQTVSAYSDLYDKSLLVKVPRYMNREAYDIDGSDLPFVGYDVWNCYEVSAITKSGRPVTGALKITCPADSEYHVESKSIKLYLNSFNMNQFGDSKKECVSIIESTVAKDLSELLQADVECKLHTYESQQADTFGENAWLGFNNFDNIEELVDFDDVKFTSYKSDETQLEGEVDGSAPISVRLHTDMLRSNCRVTNQPDWGDVYVYMHGKEVVTPESFGRYIVSHRKVSHFHEEICEMIYKHLLDRFNPDELMVACLYTRRGGLDINPVRASSEELLDQQFHNVEFLNEKTLRQ